VLQQTGPRTQQEKGESLPVSSKTGEKKKKKEKKKKDRVERSKKNGEKSRFYK